MLILTRRNSEVIRIGEEITIRVLNLSRKGQVKLGITAPPALPVHREEIFQKIYREKQA